MRYYILSMVADEEYIKKHSKVRINDYSYDNPIAAVNALVQKNTDNNMAFFIYRVDDTISRAAFAFDEQKTDLQAVFGSICDLLKDNFEIISKSEPEEITMLGYLDLFLEGKRHECISGATHRVLDSSKLWPYYLESEGDRALPFEMDERIASDDVSVPAIFDKNFHDEIANIAGHKLAAPENTNMAQYTISGNSRDAEFRMADVLVRNLYKANRLSSRRIAYVSDLKPRFYERDNYLEKIIENNYGGTVVIDLTERFGFSPSEYVAAANYIRKLFRRHCNRCLFIFTYNMKHPGYSFYLLPKVAGSVITVPLKEGEGSRKAALNYLKSLIRESEYSANIKDAAEFMKLFDGKMFTQTKVIEAFERFGPWCINKNMSGVYDFNVDDRFYLDRESDTGSYMDKLNKLIGLDIVKRQINNVIASDVVEKERMKHSGGEYQPMSSHMIFAGNPGSAKTTVAEIFAGIAREKGILTSGTFVARGGMDLSGLCCVSAIREAFVAAKGGVLFIDEAYSLQGDTAVSTLIQEMENQRDNVIVILAGYNERMHLFLEQNEGLKSRIPHWVDFPDYSTDELTQIFRYMMEERHITATEDAVTAASLIFDRMRLVDDFGNGRFVRNLLDRAVLNQSGRLMALYGESSAIPANELDQIVREDISNLDDGMRDVRPEGAARAELESMIGLESAKEIIGKAIAKFKLDKICMDRGIPRSRGSMHMVFTGNPGTAKTTVARLCAEILNDEKILSTGSFVEVGRADLVGDHVGETAKLVKRKFSEAQGGVLFIDEAYSLCDFHEGSFGDEAINTIVQEMENHREDVVVIFAGYPKPMKEFLERNPGMRSRIAFYVGFEDYSTDELCEITHLMLSKKNMAITEDAMDKLRRMYDVARINQDYGNGRYVRKLLEEAEMNLANRVISLPKDELTSEAISTINASDIPEFKLEKRAEFRIGFAS